jgi:DNA-binding FadR family transcriptional regulator
MIHLMNKSPSTLSSIDLDSDLLNYIVQRRFQPGDRLPTINELQEADHLGISISKVREQLEVARALGLVEVRSKTGMRMKDYSFTPAVRLSLLYALSVDPSNFELFSILRNHIEVAFWHEACALLTDEDRTIMRQCVVSARAKLNGHHIRIPNEEHRTFHLTVFRHLENPFVTGLLEAYWEAYNAVELNRYADYTYHESVWDYHERILDAICAGNFDGAQALFIEHTGLLRHQPRMQDINAAQEVHDHP